MSLLLFNINVKKIDNFFILIIQMDMSQKGGSINIIIGCMFSGKSTETIRLIRRYKTMGNKNILVINHALDTRYGESVISSHDKVQLKCLSLKKLSDIQEDSEYKNSDVIFIEEGQFFKDLFDFVTNAADVDKKTIYVTGLDGDFKREMFGDICRLIPHAENITKLKALCAICKDGTLANFTKRIVSDTKQELIGTDNMYIPTCRFHYLN
jgi:thymidine kinase